jgi:membrane protein DedA with SNARE-associated domain
MEVLKLGSIQTLFSNYGYWVLLVALTLELLAFPLPGETLMSYCGYLVYKGKLNYGISVLVAFLGITIGVTTSYFIGKTLGIGFFKKYGKYVHITPERLDKASKWFDSYGNKLLVVTFFIPGVRHITGYTAGITNVSLKKFMTHSYLGALIWSFTFISLGKVLGGKWEKMHIYAGKFAVIICIILAIAAITIIIIKYYKVQIIEYTYRWINKIITTYNSLGKIKFAFIFTQFVLLVMVVLVLIVMDKTMDNEFIKFNITVGYVIRSVFNFTIPTFMNVFLLLENQGAVLGLTLCLVSFILFKSKNKRSEILGIIANVLGGEFIYYLLVTIFSMVNTVKYSIGYNFPCDVAFISVIIYGYIAFVIMEYQHRYWEKTLVTTIGIILCVLAGIAAILLREATASSVLAGYVFGLTWLTINISINQIFKIIKELNRSS